jgi:4-amino-4-deoxy-L-arabinose transferase-like glycosyltransferase
MRFERDRPTPSRLSAEAAAPLPRVALFLLLLAFALPGVFGHDLWPEDAAAFGRMWTMAHGTVADWWIPNVAGAVTPQDGPFPFWPGAVSIRAFGGWLGDIAASRVSVLLCFALAVLALWAATRRLARGEQAQPLAPAFARETEPVDYARLLADISVLLLVSTLGLLLSFHLTSADTVSVAIIAATLYGLSLASERPIAGGTLAGVCAGLFSLSRDQISATGLLLGCVAGLLLCGRSPHTRRRSAQVCAVSALMVSTVAFAAALWQLQGSGAPLIGLGAVLFSTPRALSHSDGIWLARNASWSAWPLWPLAGWSLYAWRHQLRAAHIMLPASALAGLAVALVFSSPLNEAKLVPLLAPLAVLAAFGFPTLRRTLEQWVDWFGIAVYTLFILYVWAYFLALITGTPRAMAASVLRLIPGHHPGTSLVPLVLALVVTGQWVALIVWRVRSRPRVLWRGALLSAAGVTSLWLIAVALFLPAADYNRSYRVLSEQVGRRVPQGECVAAAGLSMPLRAIVAYYGHVHFARDSGASSCRIALQAQYRRSAAAPALPEDPSGSWTLLWEGRRPVRADETWRLLRLARPNN